MGTNFYLKGYLFENNQYVETNVQEDEDDPRVHIGKRSAAGLYCWDCDMTLCQDGVELGFAFPNVARPTGVTTCSSFLWVQPPSGFRSFAEAHRDEQFVVDEYGRVCTGGEFLLMLESNCPIEYTSVGVWFA